MGAVARGAGEMRAACILAATGAETAVADARFNDGLCERGKRRNSATSKKEDPARQLVEI